MAKEYDLPPDLGELIHQDVDLARDKGWETFVKEQRGRGDTASLDQIDGHPAWRLLKMYKHQVVLVKFSTPRWSRSKVIAALRRGAHKSCHDHTDFLNEEFVNMTQKGHWVVLPASMVLELEGIRLVPPGVVDRRTCRP